MGYLTLQLKIYRPSAIKRKVMSQAVSRYGAALDFLLENHWKELDACAREGDAAGAARLADAGSMAELNRFAVQPFKDSIKAEFSAFARSCAARHRALGSFRPLRHRSVYFGRKSDSRDYCLLFDGEGRFYVKMFLLNAGEGLRGYRAPQRKQLRCLLPGLPLSNGLTRDRRRFLICPLSFGRGAGEILRSLLESPERLGTARLVQRGEDFYLSLSVAAPGGPVRQAERVMGISRGKGGVYWSVWEKGHPDAFEDGEIAWSDRYRTAKSLLAVAESRNARIVYEAKGCRDDGGEVVFGDQALAWRDYVRLCETLVYKCEWLGLETPVAVAANGMHFCCPACGNRTKHSLLREDIFLCIHCGTATEVRYAASRSLACRLDYYGRRALVFSARRLPDGVEISLEAMGFHCRVRDEDAFLEELRRFLAERRELPGKKSRSMAQKLRSASDLKASVRLEYDRI